MSDTSVSESCRLVQGSRDLMYITLELCTE